MSLAAFGLQTVALCHKNVWQRARNLRDTVKTTLLMPLVIACLVTFLLSSMQSILNTKPPTASYAATKLTSVHDVVNKNINGESYVQVTMDFYYSPNTHSGVNAMMAEFAAEFAPALRVLGGADAAANLVAYGANVYSTFAGVEIALDPAQVASGQLFPAGPAAAATLAYSLRMNPSYFGTETPVQAVPFNTLVGGGELYNSTGYLALEQWFATYAVRAFDPPRAGRFRLDPSIQRYPPSALYPDTFNVPWAVVNFELFRFVGPVFLVAALLYPILALLAGPIVDRETKMWDLLEISGVQPLAYWASYALTAWVLFLVALVPVAGVLYATGTFHAQTVRAYLALLLLYGLADVPFCLCLGFVFRRSPYFGLPTYLLHGGLALAGVFAVSSGGAVSASGNLFLGFLFPPFSVALGVFAIEQVPHKSLCFKRCVRI